MTDLTNDNAVPYWSNQNTVCMRSGKKVKPGELVKDAYGLWCHPDHADKRHPLDYVRSRTEKHRGSVRPEKNDVFGTFTADDL